MDCPILFPGKYDLGSKCFYTRRNLCGNVVRSSMEFSKSGTTVHVFPKAIKFAGTHLCIPSDMRNEPCVWLCLMDAVGVQLA